MKMNGNNKTAAIAAYITWIGFIIAICIGDRSDRYVAHHLNQALVITGSRDQYRERAGRSAWGDTSCGKPGSKHSLSGSAGVLDHGYLQGGNRKHRTASVHRRYPSDRLIMIARAINTR